ncbi:MAG: SMP-30/gluconolactonase/LRE family protein [Alphaproteobacteria bacterium]|nr:SMP-30/gluconolactonase/LRE family protein [Alphaproteobacteria bacterium]
MTDTSPSIDIICGGLEFPEGPIARSDGSLLLVEIGAGCVTRVSPQGKVERIVQLGGGPNGLAIGPNGALYVCNNGGSKMHRDGASMRVVGTSDDYSGGRIERIDLRTFAISTLYRECGGHRLNGPNDIVFDRHGGFYFTDLGKTRARDRDRGGVYYALPDGSRIEEVAFPLHTPNGLGLSPDGSTLYVAETETARLWKYRVTDPGKLELLPYPSPNGGAIVFGAGGYQRFDSLKVEANGLVCVATLQNGGITIVDPARGTAEHVALPDPFITNLCFAGPEMTTVYVTMSYSGRIGRMSWPRPGLKLNYADRPH